MDKILDLNKFDRIQLMSEFGLNTPYMTMAKRGRLGDLKKAYATFRKDRPKDLISIRTFVDDNIGVYHCPFYPFNKPQKAWELGRQLNEKYHVIFAEGVNPELTTLCGCIKIFPDRSLIPNITMLRQYEQPIALFEFLAGPGTVRDMKTKPVATIPVLLHGHVMSTWYNHLEHFPIEINHTICSGSDYFINTLQKILRKVRKFPYAYKYIVEWGVSSKKIGKLKDHIIYWEVR